MGRNRKDGTNKAGQKQFKPLQDFADDTSGFLEKELSEIPDIEKSLKPDIPLSDSKDLMIPEKKQTKAERLQAELQEKLNSIPESDYQSFKDFLLVLFSTFASVKGEHWNLTELQAEGLSRPLARIFIKYLGTFDYKDEMMLVICLGGIIVPRIQKDIENKNTENAK